MKKIFLMLVIAVIACFVFSGCKTTRNPADEAPDNFASSEQEEINNMYIYINDNRLEVTLVQNRAVTALIGILRQGDIFYVASDYGGFEKVGSLGHTLPAEDVQITAEAGDVILYCGNQLVLFYGGNAWSYTRIGKISGYSGSELHKLFGAGSVQVRISLK